MAVQTYSLRDQRYALAALFTEIDSGVELHMWICSRDDIADHARWSRTQIVRLVVDAGHHRAIRVICDYLSIWLVNPKNLPFGLDEDSRDRPSPSPLRTLKNRVAIAMQSAYDGYVLGWRDHAIKFEEP